MNQIQFLDEVVNHLTAHGWFYESFRTDFNPRGVDGIFNAQ